MITQVTLEAANRKKDRSVSLRFTTDLEQSTDQFMEMDSLVNSRGILYFSQKGELTQAEIDAIDNTEIELEGKTKSQRLRSVMYVYAKQNDLDFNDFYAGQMEKIIQKYKDKLED